MPRGPEKTRPAAPHYALHSGRCAAYKNPPHKQHIWFLPTHKANAKKTKRAVFCQRSKICILWKKKRPELNANISEICNTETP